jgi:hypothetical protein
VKLGGTDKKKLHGLSPRANYTGRATAGGTDKLKKFIHFIGSRTRGLPSCNIVPQQLRYRVPILLSMNINTIKVENLKSMQ